VHVNAFGKVGPPQGTMLSFRRQNAERGPRAVDVEILSPAWAKGLDASSETNNGDGDQHHEGDESRCRLHLGER
jgi:hypothetical protein